MIDRVLNKIENHDKLAIWQQELKDSTQEDEIFELCSHLVKFFGKTGKLDLFTGSSANEKKLSEYLIMEMSKFFDTCLSKISLCPEVISSVILKLFLIWGKYANVDILPYFKSVLENINKPFFDNFSSQIILFDDLRFAFLKSLVEISDLEKITLFVDLMCQFEKVVKDDFDLGEIYCSKSVMPFEERKAALKYRHAHQSAWLHVLKFKLKLDVVKEVLTVMHARVIPNFVKPQLLMDFMVDAYDHGGAVSLLSLNAIFVLIQYHHLDYPQFFTKLYELLEDGSLLVSAHRARFLRLLDLFLTSTHLPATIPASIVKRLARLCLFAPPGAIVAILPFVYNQIKRHPTLLVMIHRVDEADLDPFNNDEKDPLLTNAIESSLWELQSLTNHYQPNVAAIAKIFSQPMKKPQYNMEHFLSHSYETMFQTEARRKRDREPDLEFEEYNTLESLSDAFTL